MTHSLREHLRALRATLSDEAQLHASQSVCQRVRALPEWQAARHIGLYVAVHGEIDPQGLMETPHALQRFYLPAITPEKTLRFLPFTPGSALVPNRFGIPEPVPLAPGPYTRPPLDLVIVPLVAFDATCQRLGTGGGFYDRTFANPLERPLLLGVAHDFQRVDTLKSADWDVPLHGIITPDTCYWRTP